MTTPISISLDKTNDTAILSCEYGNFLIGIKHNSINCFANFRRFVSYKRKSNTYEGTFRGAIQVSKMVNMVPVQYRIELVSNMGTFGYVCTGEEVTAEDLFNKIVNMGAKKMISKANREQYIMGGLTDYSKIN